MAESRGLGLLPVLGAPPRLAVATAVVLLDLAIDLQHVLFDAVPVLWRLHRMHHADLRSSPAGRRTLPWLGRKRATRR